MPCICKSYRGSPGAPGVQGPRGQVRKGPQGPRDRGGPGAQVPRDPGAPRAGPGIPGAQGPRGPRAPGAQGPRGHQGPRAQRSHCVAFPRGMMDAQKQDFFENIFLEMTDFVSATKNWNLQKRAVQIQVETASHTFSVRRPSSIVQLRRSSMATENPWNRLEANLADCTIIGFDGCDKQEIQSVFVEEWKSLVTMHVKTLSRETLQATDMNGDLIRWFP